MRGTFPREDADRAAIDRAIAALNDPARRPGLFTRDADCQVDFERLIDLHIRNTRPVIGVIGIDEPWSTLTTPRVVTGNIRFVTADVATVDGASVIQGAVRKERGKRRINAVRAAGHTKAARWANIY